MCVQFVNILGPLLQATELEQEPLKLNQCIGCEPYLIFVIFLHEQNFWRIKFTPKKRANYDKMHSKLPNFCVITAKYTVNCQFFALNL